MSSVYIFTLGCPNRYLDTEKYKQFFLKNGYTLIDQPEKADYILINTCAFRKFEEDRSIGKIQEFKKRKKPEAKIVICGCLPGINEPRMKGVFSGVYFMPKNHAEINNIFPHTISFEKISDANQFKNQPSKKITSVIKNFFILEKKNFFKKMYRYLKEKVNNSKNKPRGDKFFLRIARGCSGNCSYCGIKHAIGNLESKDPEIIIEEFKKGLEKGYQKVTIVSDDSGAYGIDINYSLPQLLLDLINLEKNIIIDLEEINARWLVHHGEKLTKIFKNNQFTSILVAVQSGSDKILEKMNRLNPGGRLEIIKTIKNLKQAIPSLKIKAQYIIGFPGETKDDLEDTYDSIIRSKIDEVNLFKFDPKPNTLAFEMPHQIKDREINKRIKSLAKKLKRQNIKVLTNN
jgi:tRNA A37 methylthiotransferase MiaB